MKITIIVEGQTEKAFFPTLREFLSARLEGKMPNLDPLPQGGRIPKGERLRRIVENALSGQRPADAVIALTDVYTGTGDFEDATDAKEKMKEWVDNPRFFPHAAQHDFEAWLLPYWNTIQHLAQHDKNGPTGRPESVNHRRPPSYRIKEIFQLGQCRDSYSKPRDAPRILKGNDLAVSACACGELRAFLDTILTLCGGQPLACDP